MMKSVLVKMGFYWYSEWMIIDGTGTGNEREDEFFLDEFFLVFFMSVDEFVVDDDEQVE